MQNPNPYDLRNELSDMEDKENNKAIAALSYLLFFLPLLAARNSRFAMYHANQSLVFLLAMFAGNFVLGLIPFIGWLLIPFFNLAGLGYMIIGVMNAVGGKTQPLPFMPNVEILK
ncbi:DUF4870 domain-containing protein [Saccharibacillus kuerlensis]|uniref:DUF4870 domain-containing protein n=1 Tax=Saccharibacillus kuerlensis TaxID=459527 RepID=A0ABQ2L300_9BACL|nr:hypothetical protein [Saccharibacillus kuerlensis]GGO00859.1 hypothetical protein GCM10010969_22530 [Saccharibacillus kuerlensis]